MTEDNGMRFEDFEVGQRFLSKARTITETHLVTYVGISGIALPLFVDLETAKKSQFGERIIPAFLTMSVATGLLEDSMDLRHLIAVLGFDKLRLRQPVRIDDTIHIEIEIVDKRPTQDALRGVMEGQVTVLNQDSAIVASYTITWLFPISEARS